MDFKPIDLSFSVSEPCCSSSSTEYDTKSQIDNFGSYYDNPLDLRRLDLEYEKQLIDLRIKQKQLESDMEFRKQIQQRLIHCIDNNNFEKAFLLKQILEPLNLPPSGQPTPIKDTNDVIIIGSDNQRTKVKRSLSNLRKINPNNDVIKKLRPILCVNQIKSTIHF